MSELHLFSATVNMYIHVIYIYIYVCMREREGGIFLSRLSPVRFISGSCKTNGEIASKILTANFRKKERESEEGGKRVRKAREIDILATARFFFLPSRIHGRKKNKAVR